MVRIGVLILLTGILLGACNNDDNYVPKPSTYLALNLPERTYETYVDTCGYQFNKPSYFNMKNVDNSCKRDIELTSMNGVIHLGVMRLDTTLNEYINYAIDKVGEHKIKASAILDTSFIRSEDRVFGTLFELQGNVASPFQFYLTDSTDRFVSGAVYFNVRPNYDSIKPALNFVKKDLYEFMETLEWTEE